MFFLFSLTFPDQGSTTLVLVSVQGMFSLFIVANLTVLLCPRNIEMIIVCLVHGLDLNLARDNELGLVLFFT